MNVLNHILDRLWEKICKKCNICHIYLNRVGVKNYNISLFLPLAKPISTDIIKIPYSELYLGIDYLRDEYSLVGCKISESPHYYFIEAISKGEVISNTDYIRRAKNGTLDVRRGCNPSRKLEFYKNKYNERIIELRSGILAPVLVYQIEGKYYIYDGKHRAALCALMRQDVNCQMVSNDRMDARYELISNNLDYSKHHLLFRQFNS